MMRTPQLVYFPQTRVESFSAGVPTTQHYLHEEKRVPKVLPSITSRERAKAMTPKHPSICTLLGSTDVEMLKIAEQAYWGECIVVPSVLPHQWHEECMRELHQELTKCMARAGLQNPARATTRSRRCSYSHSTSWTHSPSPGPWG